MRLIHVAVALFIAVCVGGGPALAQEPVNAAPMLHRAGLERELQRKAKLELPSMSAEMSRPIDYRLPPLRDEDLRPKLQKLAAQAGVHRKLEAQAFDLGNWALLDDGRRVWRVAVHSPNAQGLRLHFEDFSVGSGRVWLHDGTRQEGEIVGPYSGRGPNGTGEFWSDFVLAENVIIEFEPEHVTPVPLAPPFRVSELSHLLPGVLPGADSQLQPNAGSQNYSAAPCNLDVSCYPEWADTARAVGHIVFEEDGASFVCSGTLVNTVRGSRIPYFVTADHCVSSQQTARTVQAFWFYQTSNCNGAPATRREAQRTLGATYLVSGGIDRGDYSLIRLDSVADGVMFSGWSSQVPPEGTETVGIHHPRGDYKRISFATRVRTGSQLAGANPAYYYTVAHSGGVTEGGSSGSGLFVAPGVLVGMLSSGPKVDTPDAICNFNPLTSNYSRFSNAFPDFRDYLEDRTTGTVPPPNPGGGGGGLVSGQPQSFSTPVLDSPTLLVGQYGFRVQVPEGATRLDIRLAAQNAEVAFVVRYGQDVEFANGNIVADYASPGRTGNEVLSIAAGSNPPLRAGTYYIGLAVFTTGRPVQGTLTATITGAGNPGGGDPGTPGGGTLTSGQPRNFSTPVLNSPTLLVGQYGFRVEVPQGATRLEIRLAAQNADMGFAIRHGQDVQLSGGRIVADHTSPGRTGNETLTITTSSTPPLRAGTYYIGFAVYTVGRAVPATITATVTGGNPGGGNPGGGGSLVSGQPQSFTTPVLNSATLLVGQNGFRVQVPQGATRLDIRLAAQNAEIGFAVRLGQDVEFSNGNIVADYASPGRSGNETLSITSSSNPPLRAGTYYIGLAVFTTGRAIPGSITATITGPGGGNPGGGGGNALTSGQPRQFSLPAVDSATLFNVDAGLFTVEVPAGATRLEIRLSTSTPGVDVDVFARHGIVPRVAGGQVDADHSSEGPGGEETIVIPTASSRPLRAGTYYIALALFTRNTPASGTITATVTGGADPGNPGNPGNPGGGNPTQISPGTPARFTIPAVQNATLLSGRNGFVVNVPEGASRVQVQLATTTPNADVDLFIRYGSEPQIAAGKVQADSRSTSPMGSETVTISSTGDAPLRAGSYYIALGVFTAGVEISGTLTASLTSGSNPSTRDPVVLQSGSPARFNIPAQTNATLLNGGNGFVIDVPEGASRLEIQLSSTTQGVDLDLFARHGTDTGISTGKVVADHNSDGPTGNEVISITSSSNPPLRAGRYFISIGVFTTGTAISGTVTASVVGNQPQQPPASSQELTTDAPAKFSLPPVNISTLFIGRYGYRINVPEGATRLQINLDSDVPAIDVDLYARYGSEVDLDGEGNVIADHGAAGDTGNERLIITPNSQPTLRPGVYYVGLAQYTTGVTATGSISISIERGSDSPTVSSARPLNSGEPAAFSLPSVERPTLFTGEYAYRFTVPEGGGRLEVTTETATPGVDIDLFVRYGAEPELQEGRVVTDYRAVSDFGNEVIQIDGLSTPPLRPGVYFIALGQYTTGTAATGRVTARFVATGPQRGLTSGALEKEHALEDPGNQLEPKKGWPVATPVTPEAMKASEPAPELAPLAAPIKRGKGERRIGVQR